MCWGLRTRVGTGAFPESDSSCNSRSRGGAAGMLPFGDRGPAVPILVRSGTIWARLGNPPAGEQSQAQETVLDLT
jgi:hypothetical protein